MYVGFVLATFPYTITLMPKTHNGGPKLIEHLKELNIQFPINDSHDAARKTLRAFDTSLTKMEDWLR
jgi:hypothetical protein